MTALPRNYDAWRLASPDEHHYIGEHEGETCGRYPEPDEDAPRGYRPRPCGGLMMVDAYGIVRCESCGEVA